MSDILYTARIAANNIQQLSKAEIDALDIKLTRIVRSNGDVEFATEAMIEQLEANRKQRRNQRKLAEMRDYNYSKKPSRLGTALKRLLG